MGMKVNAKSLAVFSTATLFLMIWTWYLTIMIRFGSIPHPTLVSSTMYSDIEKYGAYLIIFDLLFLLASGSFLVSFFKKD